jgi:hypothetical protein
VIEQLVAPFAAVHPDPVTVAVPAILPVPVNPDTVKTDVLLDENVPPVIATVEDIAVVPCAVSDAGVSVTVLAGHVTTLTIAPNSGHPVAKFGAVQFDPVTVALPAATPVPVDPVTERTPLLLEEKVPLLQPAGWVSAVVDPTFTVDGVAVTLPTGHVTTGIETPLNGHPVVPFGSVQFDPVTVALPAATPVPVDPETESTPVLLDENVPPVQLAGAESATVLPTVAVLGVTETAPLKHTRKSVEHVAAPLSQLRAYVVLTAGFTD